MNGNQEKLMFLLGENLVEEKLKSKFSSFFDVIENIDRDLGLEIENKFLDLTNDLKKEFFKLGQLSNDIQTNIDLEKIKL